MSSAEMLPPVLDVDALLAPISDDRPCGALREHQEDGDLEMLYTQLSLDFDMARRIEKAKGEIELLSRSQRDDALKLSAGRPDSASESPPWKRILEQSVQILTRHSKDTRVAAWLVESACRVHGLIGLRDGLNVCHELVRRYGDQLFPLGSSPEDKIYRLGPIKNLNGSSSLSAGIRQVSFDSRMPCNFHGYEVAKYLASRPAEEQAEMYDMGKLSTEDFAEAVMALTSDEVAKFNKELEETQAAAEAVNKMLLELSGAQMYALNKIVDLLAQIRSWFKVLCEERPASDSASDGNDEVQSTTSAETSSGGSSGSQPAGQAGPSIASVTLKNREEALNALLKVAKFFRTTEPHSPLSYALEQAVRWGKMDLPSLLKDLVQDSSVLSEVYRRMGIVEQENND